MKLTKLGILRAPSPVPITVLFFVTSFGMAHAAVPKPASIGFVLGDPSGISMSYPLGQTRALELGFGPDYFGSPLLQLGYVWQFDAFESRVVHEYVGPGVAIAFARGINTFYTREMQKESFAANEDNSFGVGGTAVLGMLITPIRSPLEFFVESGPLLPFNRIFDLDINGAIGLRYRL